MSKKPPALRKAIPQPSEELEKTTSKLGQTIKNRMGKIQTKPDFIDKVKNFRFGEIQTKPEWMTRTTKQPSAKEGVIEWVRIIPFAGEKYTADKLPSKLGNMSGIIHFRFYKDARSQLHIYAGHASGRDLRKALRQRVPNADLQSSDEPPAYEEKFVNRVGELGGGLNENGRLEAILDALEDETYLDIAFEKRPDNEFKQVLRDFIHGGSSSSSLRPGARGVLDAWNEVFNPFSSGQPSHKKSGKSSKQQLSVEEKDQIKRIQGLLSETSNYFRVVIKIGVKKSNHFQPIFNELNSQMKQQHRFLLANEEKKKLWQDTKDRPNALWREQELAVLVALPDMTNAQMLQTMPHLRPGERTLEDDILTDGVAIGRLIHPVKEPRLIKIPAEQFLKHALLTGKTGTGKTSTAIQAIQSILDDWVTNPDKYPGFSFIDPNRSALVTILNRLLHMEQHLGYRIPWEKIHYLDMSSKSEYPVGLNLLHCSTDDDVTQVSQNIVDMIMSTYGSSGTLGKTEKLIDNGLATLLSDRSRVHTIFGLNYVYMYPEFRKSLTIHDPMLKLFWKTDGSDISTSELTAMNNRLRPLLNTTAMRRIFGQTNWTLKIREWMDEGHIVLIDALGLSQVGRAVAMGQLVTEYHVTANQRMADISKPHILMIDEAHLIQIPILGQVMAVDRKFGLSLVLITQSPEQINSDLQTAITENMGTFMSCKVGPKSARSIASMMNNAFDANTLQDLPGNDVAVLTELDKVPFSFKVRSDPPIQFLPNGNVAKYDKEEGGETWQAQQWAMEKSRELAMRDGRPVEMVDHEFAEYDDWWQQFAPDEENDDNLVSNRKPSRLPTDAGINLEDDSDSNNYVPTGPELEVLQGIIEMVKEDGEWAGSVADLIADLNLESSDWNAQRLGVSLGRTQTWFKEQRIMVEYTRPRGRSHWKFWAN